MLGRYITSRGDDNFCPSSLGPPATTVIKPRTSAFFVGPGCGAEAELTLGSGSQRRAAPNVSTPADNNFTFKGIKLPHKFVFLLLLGFCLLRLLLVRWCVVCDREEPLHGNSGKSERQGRKQDSSPTRYQFFGRLVYMFESYSNRNQGYEVTNADDDSTRSRSPAVAGSACSLCLVATVRNQPTKAGAKSPRSLDTPQTLCAACQRSHRLCNSFQPHG
jgi:hypothetical protein